MRIRRATPADIPAIMSLACESPSAAHWSRDQYEALFAARSEQPSERFAWVAESEDEGEILAFVIAHRIEFEWELENIVVGRKARRRGVGKRLLAELAAHARARSGHSIFLEVRASNQTARALYRKAGFTETGLRKSYYANPVENAILCVLSL